ncbi:hypothetical protein LG047_00475 [Methylocystis sp. WRRC1]|uniref:hypothetical protein n=1 Tax=Methylocystis sp. WRRC1 TaxID=1732014 RepID=UPI001D1522B8|nr:hypothetical protein [Methylocystis sp. WRRC1]MCC3243811.1 hypothetical protein [Methylocystis sp. WRRC1]
MTVPAPLRGEIKRPDYLVGIPGIGLVAFDVKAKTVYPEGLIFDVDEVRKLRALARLFHLTVYFACLDPEGGPHGYWVRLDQLDFVPQRQADPRPALRRRPARIPGGTVLFRLRPRRGARIRRARPGRALVHGAAPRLRPAGFDRSRGKLI